MALSHDASGPAPEARPEFVPYVQALTALGVEERELRGLLVAGRLRGFRDEASLKFLRTDIDALLRERERDA